MASVTAVSLKSRKEAGEKIAVLTAYDFPTAQLLDECDIDVILVGDSCATALMGHKDTLSMTMDAMIHHTAMVSAATKNALVVGDMPFLSYQVSPEEAVRNAGRFIAEGRAQAVKLEGSVDRVGQAIQKILNAGIPVMGHIGLIPQSVHQIGGYKVQGRGDASRQSLLRQAKELEEIGCFAIVLECVMPKVAEEITASLTIPTIGIGAGAACDGQVLVMHDMLGWGRTKFAKCFGDVKALMEEAFKSYIAEVKSGTYPAKEHEYE